jgi:uncharacterized membrane protein
MISGIEHGFRLVASFVALGVEAVAVVVIAFGAIETLLGLFGLIRRSDSLHGGVRQVWVRFAGWILLSLEFTLAADILRTVIAPTWEEIGKLAAIAAIRTALNYFLGLDIREAEAHRKDMASSDAVDTQCCT